MDEKQFKERNREIWKKVNQKIILNSVGIFSPAWIILKRLFSDRNERIKNGDGDKSNNQIKREIEKEKKWLYS